MDTTLLASSTIGETGRWTLKGTIGGATRHSQLWPHSPRSRVRLSSSLTILAPEITHRAATGRGWSRLRRCPRLAQSRLGQSQAQVGQNSGCRWDLRCLEQPTGALRNDIRDACRRSRSYFARSVWRLCRRNCQHDPVPNRRCKMDVRRSDLPRRLGSPELY